MGIIKGVLKNDIENTIAIVTDIGVIPFIDEGIDNNQAMIDGFNKGVHNLYSGKWCILDENEKADYYDVSADYWL